MNDIQNHKRCILNTDSGRKFIMGGGVGAGGGYPTLDSYYSFTYTRGLILVYA